MTGGYAKCKLDSTTGGATQKAWKGVHAASGSKGRPVADSLQGNGDSVQHLQGTQFGHQLKEIEADSAHSLQKRTQF